MTAAEIIPQIPAALTSAKALLDLINGVKGIAKTPKDREALSAMDQRATELHKSLAEAYEKTVDLLKERDKAQRDIKDEQDKNKLYEDYELVEVREGLFLRKSKSIEGSAAPRHYACPKCFTDKIASPMQQPNPARRLLECPRCSFSCDPRTAEEIPKPPANTRPKRGFH